MNSATTLPINIFCSVVLVTGLTVPCTGTGIQPTLPNIQTKMPNFNPLNTPTDTLSVKEEGNMEFEQFSGAKVPTESPSPISLLTIYEESARAGKLPRNDGSLSLSWGYNVDTAGDGVNAEPVRGSEGKERLAAEAMETKQQLSINDKMSEPRGAVKDQYGNLTRFKIGPESEEADVSIFYDDASMKPPTVRSTTIKRADGTTIDYVREKDPSEPDAPSIYTETRNGSRGDLLYGSFDVAQDGRMTLYFDFEKKRPAITFNPKTGYEEYP